MEIKSFFVSDLHGKKSRYEKLFEQIVLEEPAAVFFGGDLYPSFKELQKSDIDFFEEVFKANFESLKKKMKDKYPQVFVILGNDDPRTEEEKFQAYPDLWTYSHLNKTEFKNFSVFGYSYIPPTPFLYKDWELYDVSRYVDPGCIHPIEGKRSVDPGRDIEYSTIKKDLEEISENENINNYVFLFHSPPYKTKLDRAALDGMFFDHVPLDVHVGSIAIKDFIDEKQPHLTLHGHVHESSRITGSWQETFGNTISFNAATDDNLLSLIIFDLKNPENAKRQKL